MLLSSTRIGREETATAAGHSVGQKSVAEKKKEKDNTQTQQQNE